MIFSNQGHIEILCGPMFSGKTEELIRRINRARYAKQKVLIVSKDTRCGKGQIKTHAGKDIKVLYLDDLKDVYAHVENINVLGVDEGQFFGENITDICVKLAELGIRVIVTFLNQDYQGKPFDNVIPLYSEAEYITKLSAICIGCGDYASKTYRKIGSQDRILEGSENIYDPLCRICYNKKSNTINTHF